MAAAFAIVKRRPDVRETIVDMTADGAYPANGYPVAARDVGLLSIDSIVVYDKTQQGNLAAFDPVNSKIKIYQTGAALSGVLSEAIGADLTTANVFRLECKGDPIL